MVGFRGFSAGFDVEVCVVLLVGETGDSQDACRIGRGGVATEFMRHSVQEDFGLFAIHAFNCSRTWAGAFSPQSET